MAKSSPGKEILASLHPQVREAYAQFHTKLPPPSAIQPSEIKAALSIVFVGLVGLLLAFATMKGANTERTFVMAIILIPTCYYFFSVAYALLRNAFGSRSLLPKNLPGDLATLNRVFPVLSGTDTERAYSRLFLAIWNHTEIDATTRDTLLNEINGLLSDSLQLQDYLNNSAATQSVYTVEGELSRLQVRLRETTDPMTRQAIDQSISLRQAQLQDLNDLQTARIRLQAQQEVILTALVSLQTTLERLSIADSQTALSDLERIQTVTSSVRQQTHAVEQAVQEVVQIGRRD